MATPNLLTYADLVEHLIANSGGSGADGRQQDIRRAILIGVRELTNYRKWTYFYQVYRLTTQPPYNTGTIAYTNSTQTATLAGGTWPTWAAGAQLHSGRVACNVIKRISGTQLLLDPVVNFGQDLAAGTAYVLYKDSYTLPENYKQQDALHNETTSELLYAGPNEWLDMKRRVNSSGMPQYWTIMQDTVLAGRMALFLFPYPSYTLTHDFIYSRAPSRLKYSGYIDVCRQGTVSISGTAVTGIGTAFTADMAGAVLRVGGVSTSDPTGLAGGNPYVDQQVIDSVTDETNLTLKAPFGSNIYSQAKYQISDVVDVDFAMHTALLRSIEYQFAVIRRDDNAPAKYQQYLEAVSVASDLDSRSFSGRTAGHCPPFDDPLWLARVNF